MSKDSSVSHSYDAFPPSPLSSCLRSRPDSNRRNRAFSVSFPEDENNLITGYLEPANPWEYADNVSREDVITNYKSSCEKHGINPLPVVVEQLQVVDIEASRSDCLNLKGATLLAVACESLEEILKRVQFKNINVEATALDDEGSVALFDMIEYYESATHLNISGNRDIAVRGWQACSRMIKKTRCLELLEARNVTLNEQYMPILSRALKLGTQLQVLKLENCFLSGRPVIILAAALKLNTSLRELFLADNSLNISDAVQLGAVLRSNQTLQLLDVSNNQIQDAGVGHILDGLAEQTSPQSGCNNTYGLCILVLWNNHLTRNAAKHFARALARSTSLEILNIGHNVLTNESLHVMKDSLQQNRTLLRLGMQSTHLSCEGAIALAECVADNPVIQRIDLRDNNLQVAGLMALALSMKVNRSVNQLDLDDSPKKKLENSEALKQYRSLLAEIRGYCRRNEQEDFSEEEPTTPEDNETITAERSLRVPSNMASRKISLTCETLMRSVCISDPENPGSQLLEPRRISGGRLRSPAPSPVPSPVSSPIPSPLRTRFQVSRVNEPAGSPSSCSSSPFTPPSSISPSPTRFFPSPGASRFRVTLVQPSDVPPPPQPLVSSPSGNNITVGFTFKLNDKNISPKTSPENSESVSPASEIAVTPAQVSKLSETLAEEEKQTHKQDTEGDVAERLPIEPLGTPCLSPSQSVTSLEDSADLEVRQIMDRHDNQTQCDKLVEITDVSGNVHSSESSAQKHFSKLEDSVQPKQLSSETEPSLTGKSVQENHSPREATVEDSKLAELQGIGHKQSLISVVPSVSSGNKSEATCEKELQGIGQKQSLSSVVPSVSSGNKSETTCERAGGEIQLAALKSITTVNQRVRKISWIAPAEPVSSTEQKAPSSLEKLLGLFQHPTSFFSKVQPQYKATTVIVNEQPVANSNASFLLTAGPLAGAAQEARLRGARISSSDPLEEDIPETHPATDLLNNNSNERSDHGSINITSGRCEGSSRGSSPAAGTTIVTTSPSPSAPTCCKSSQLLGGNGGRACSHALGEKDLIQARAEDENFNVSKRSSGSDVSSAVGDKLWCSTLSSVCGASVVLPWAQSTTASDNECCGGSILGHENTVLCASPDSLGFQESSVCILKEDGKQKDSTSKLYSSIMKNSPANGVNKPLSSASLWSATKESRESLFPVMGVRLVGGGDTSSEGDLIKEGLIDASSSKASECKDSQELVKVEAENDSVNPADPQ